MSCICCRKCACVFYNAETVYLKKYKCSQITFGICAYFIKFLYVKNKYTNQ